MPATRAAFARLGAQTLPSTPEQTRDYMRSELQKWTGVLRAIKDKPAS